MQRDLKIGISLCVLMFGVVGALMFRREPPGAKSQGLQLKTARQLDQKIAQRARTPYMTGDIEDVEPAESATHDPSDGTRPRHLLPPTHLTEEDDGFLAPHDHSSDHSTAGAEGTASGQSRPGGRSGPRIVAESVTAGAQTHTIQPGDTLSSLAEKYLGSQKRFQEIFDANRSVLQNPNRLPEGVVITIPTAVAAKTSKHVSDHGAVATRQTLEARRPLTSPESKQSLEQYEPIAPGGEVGEIITPPEPLRKLPGIAEATESADGLGAIPPTSDVPARPSDDKGAEQTRKRFHAPTRVPFSNNTAARTNAARRTAESPDGSLTSKETPQADSAHDAASGIYRVRRGDSLERISQRVYGTPKRAAEIFNANKDKLASPDAIKEGLELTLP